MSRVAASRPGSVVAGAAALVTTVGAAFSGAALLAAGGGTAAIAAGLIRGTRRPVHLGAVGLFGGVVAAGLAGAPILLLVVLAGSTAAAWRAAGDAVELGTRLDPSASTRRMELRGAAATLGVTGLAGGCGYLVYRVSTGGKPAAALVALLVAAVAIVHQLRE